MNKPNQKQKQTFRHREQNSGYQKGRDSGKGKMGKGN